MDIINPSADLLDPEDVAAGTRLLRKVEWCGRISHRSEESQTPDSWHKFILAVVLGHGDWSIVEHVSASVKFVVDRGVSHELVRHRLASYTQSSTRFINYVKKMPAQFIRPVDIQPTYLDAWGECIIFAEQTYRKLVTSGHAPQIARSVLPNALATTVIMTCNLRNWRHFLLMRTTKESHPQMRQVTIPLLSQFKERIPLLFDDIEPEQRQADNLRKPR